jgi:hypothetical protein
MTPEELAAIRQRCEKATPGPWCVGKGVYSDLIDTVGDPHRGLIASVDDEDCDVHREAAHNRRFIAHARTDIPALLDEVGILRGALYRACALLLDDNSGHDRIMGECEDFIQMATEALREALCTSDTPPA